MYGGGAAARQRAAGYMGVVVWDVGDNIVIVGWRDWIFKAMLTSTMRVGFDVSDLRPERAGVYTYASQLLRTLGRMAEPPELMLLEGDGLGRRPVGTLIGDDDTPLERAPYIRMRALPALGAINGPWRRGYRGRRLAWSIDRRLLLPLWRQAYHSPRLTPWLIKGGTGGRLDVCHWSDSAFLRLPGVAHVMTVHDTIVLRRPEWQLPDSVYAHTHKLYAIARYATRIIADSEQTRRDVIALLGVAPERIDVIPLAAGPEFHPVTDPAEDRTVLARYGLRDSDYVLFVGTIEPRKNLVRLATAFKAAVDREPGLTTRLVLAGGRGWLTGPITEGLEALRLGERLVMPGRVPQEDLPALLREARAMAYVSLYEGFGLPPLEAMACGTPVVASAISSLPEVVGDAGLLVDPYDVGAIAAALERVLMDDALRAELAARGSARAATFSWHRTAELTVQTYRHAMAAHAPPCVSAM